MMNAWSDFSLDDFPELGNNTAAAAAAAATVGVAAAEPEAAAAAVAFLDEPESVGSHSISNNHHSLLGTSPEIATHNDGVHFVAYGNIDVPEPVVSNNDDNDNNTHDDDQVTQPPETNTPDRHHTSPSTTTPTTTAVVFSPTSLMVAESGVDGIGMWKSWTHNYEQPRFACLDLLDNCFDATLHPNFDGKILMEYLPPNGIVILNNAFKPIKSLEETLTAYRSEKNSKKNNVMDTLIINNKQAIGEYGVGLKQACATLSHTSFILTRNKHVFELGVIAESLQTRNGVLFPRVSFSLLNGNDDDDASSEQQILMMMTAEQIDEQLHYQISKIMKENPHIFYLATIDLGAGNRKSAIQRLVDRCNVMLNEDWKSHDHVFQLIITDFMHAKSSISSSAGVRKQPAICFLEEIRDLLPKHYINIPTNCSFHIFDQRVNFTYWQNRLVEMTKFEVNIPKDRPIQHICHEGWEREGYDLSIYCGFDALRVEDIERNQAKTCQLCIYSRRSGRLIEVTPDARDMLGMRSSGSDFSQGLTVIVDDFRGELPLKPTKDGLTWSKEESGEVHKNNLLAWVGAVGYLYWTHHEKQFKLKFPDPKNKLRTAVLSFIGPIRKRQIEVEQMAKNGVAATEDFTQSMECIEHLKFTMFSDVIWAKQQSQNTMKVTIRKKTLNLNTWPGPATLFRFNETHYFSSAEAAAGDSEVPAECVSAEGTTSSNQNKETPKKVGRPRGRPPTKKRRVSSFGLLGAPSPVKQQQPSESSSGSEEEDLLVLPSPVQAPKLARRRTTGTDVPSNSKGTVHNSSLGVIVEEPRHDEANARNIARIQELEQALQRSQENERMLQAELLAVKGQLWNQAKSQEDQQAVLNENTLLRQQKNQLEKDLQYLQQQAAAMARESEASMLKQDIERLKHELQEREYTIRGLQGTNGFNWGDPNHGDDMI